jgi:hypothetical protein
LGQPGGRKGEGEVGQGRAGEKKLGRGERDRKWAERLDGFSFLYFSKIPNSISFCLFYCELFRAPKILKFFVKPPCAVYYLGKI